MKFIFSFLLSLLTLSSAFCQTYITNVTLVDVESGKLIPEQTVTITGNIISGIQPSAKTKISYNAIVINGKGKFLMPGLIDAHVHFFQSGGLYTRPDAIDLRKYSPYKSEIEWAHTNMEDLLRRYLREGITTVIDPGSTFNFLEQRDSFKNKTFASAVYMAGPLITTYEPDAYKNLNNDEPFSYVANIGDVKTAIQKQILYHPDFIKIWFITDLSGQHVEDSARKFLPIVKATIDEAHKNGLRVAVHATERITALLAAQSGCDYLVHEIEDSIVSDDFISLLKQNNIILCPTLTVANDYISTFTQENKFSFYELSHSCPQPLGSLYDLKYISDTALIKRYKGAGADPYNAYSDSIRKVNLKKMADAGVTIASGTDAGNIGTLHATSYLNELIAMQESGLTNWQILQSSTINGAKAIGKEKEFGSIVVGKKADIILLDGNPIDSIQNLRKINIVINKGNMIIPDTLLHESPLELVQHQSNAYAVRNIDAFLESYSNDVELYNFPDKLFCKGKDAMRREYLPMFQNNPDIHCEVQDRIILGNTIIDKEYFSGVKSDNSVGIAIYKIVNNKIAQVYFINK